MAPKKSTTTAEERSRRTTIEESLPPSSSPASPQEKSQTGVVQTKLSGMMKDMVKNQRKRHETKLHALEKDYAETLSRTKESIGTLFEEHEDISTQIYDAQLARLNILIQEKKRIELEMRNRVEKLKFNHHVYARDMAKVAEHRARQLRWERGGMDE